MNLFIQVEFGWWTIIPPLLAIGLALLTKEVISSLMIGILSGSLILAQGDFVKMLEYTFSIMVEQVGEKDNISILLFLGLLGTLVVLVTKAGGARAYGAWATTKIHSKRGACLATSALGCLIFIDDYFNCLTVGTVMRPVTDRYGISRAKLAYLLDATAAPICILAPISSWGASIATYMSDATGKNGMTTFLQTIPYNLYAILTIVMVLVICITSRDFGPMARSERQAREGKDKFEEKRKNENGDNVTTMEEIVEIEESNGNGKVLDLLLPIATLILVTILTMIYTGGGFGDGKSVVEALGVCDAPLSLLIGTFLALILTLFLYIPRKIMSFKECMESVNEGIKSMTGAIVILILAWTIGGICSNQYLQTGEFIGRVVRESNFPTILLPAIVFIVAAFLAFATGTSWGTLAIFIPVGVSISVADPSGSLLIPILGATLAGAVYGDHISPISDTTILSSTGADCDHMEHVSTQLVYASIVGVCCIVGYGIMGIVQNAWVPLGSSMLLLISSLFFIQKRHS